MSCISCILTFRANLAYLAFLAYLAYSIGKKFRAGGENTACVVYFLFMPGLVLWAIQWSIFRLYINVWEHITANHNCQTFDWLTQQPLHLKAVIHFFYHNG